MDLAFARALVDAGYMRPKEYAAMTDVTYSWHRRLAAGRTARWIWELRASDPAVPPIAVVLPRSKGHPCYRARYDWPHGGGGNSPEMSALINSVPRARRWAEAQLSRFANPPTIKTTGARHD